MYIISACLLGQCVRYDGGSNLIPKVVDFAKKHSYIACCPEMLGGLPCPRPPSEIKDGRVLDIEGRDITLEFEKGAYAAWEKAMKRAREKGEAIQGAILKSKSPSCGAGQVYDGTFQGILTRGDGRFAQLLKEKNIEVLTEEEIDDKL